MLDNFKKIILDIPIRWKFLLLTILISFIPVTFIGLFSYNVSQNYLKKIVTQSAIMKSEAVNLRLEKYLSNIDDTSLQLISNSAMQRLLSEYDPAKRYIYESELKSLFSSIISSKNTIQSIIMYDRDGNMQVYETNSPDDWVLKNILSENIAANTVYPEVKKLAGKRIWTKLFMNTAQISMIRTVNELGTQNQIGTIVININENNLKEVIHDIDTMEGGGLVISEPSGNIIYTSADVYYIPEIMDIPASTASYKTIHYNNSQYLNIYYISEFCGWRINTLIPLNILFSKVAAIREITIIIVGLCLLLVLAFSLLITNFLTKPIRKLSNLMRKVEDGDLEIRFENSQNDEIGKLGQNFNSMLEKTKVLMDENVEKQKRLRIQELKALQSQINPHFLYNTIDTINWLAQSMDADAISEISISLANYYRLSLSKGAEIIKINDEINQVKNYLKIQKIRYGKYLNYEINISDEILNLYISKITLQPIVENSLYHGLRDKQENGVIQLNGRLEEDTLVFEIWDNGKGMNCEKLSSVRESLNKNRQEGFGLSNTNERIKLFFGDQYGIEIESIENIFTKVKVTIPIVEVLE